MAEVTVTYENEFGTVTTDAGKAAIVAALANDAKLDVTHIAFGDGAGEEYFPEESQTDLRREVYLSPVVGVHQDPVNPNVLVVETRLAADVGGWEIREAALRLGNGDTVAIASLPTHPKPVIPNVLFDTKYQMLFQVSNTSAFEFKIDPNAEATEEIVRLYLLQHDEDANAHADLFAAAKTEFDFTMVRTEDSGSGHIALTVADFPANAPSLATLRGIATADYVASDTVSINGIPVDLYTPLAQPLASGAWMDGGGIRLLWHVNGSKVFYQAGAGGSGSGSGGSGGGSNNGSGAGWNIFFGDTVPEGVTDGILIQGVEGEPSLVMVDEKLEIHDGGSLMRVIEVTAGEDHSLFLCSNGLVYSCGSNNVGQLGRIVDSASQSSINIGLIPNLTDVIATAAGICYSLFLHSDGTVSSCGLSGDGAIGRSVDSGSKTSINLGTIPNLNDVIAIAAGRGPISGHSLFLHSNGTVSSCGDNSKGQLGRVVSNAVILGLIPNLNEVIAIDAGSGESLFLHSNGTVSSCGNNHVGQIGRIVSSGSATSVNLGIIPNLTDVIAVVTAEGHSLFVHSNNTVSSCGGNDLGQLGRAVSNGSATSVNLSLIPGLTDVIAVAASSAQSIFLHSNGTVSSCGGNKYGEQGRAVSSGSATSINLGLIPTLTDIVDIDAEGVYNSSGHSLFLHSNGSISSGGYNHHGQLGRIVDPGSETGTNLGLIPMEYFEGSEASLSFSESTHPIGTILILSKKTMGDNSAAAPLLYNDGKYSLRSAIDKCYQTQLVEGVAVDVELQFTQISA